MSTNVISKEQQPDAPQSAYLTRIYQEKTINTNPVKRVVWNLLQTLVNAPESEAGVVGRLRDSLNSYCTSDTEGEFDDDDVLRQLVYSELCEHVLDLAAGYPEDHVVHTRLFELLQSMNEPSWVEGSKKGFRLVHDPRQLAETAYEFERVTYVYELPGTWQDLSVRASVYINAAAFLAKLLRDDLLLREQAVSWAWQSLTHGLDPQGIYPNKTGVPEEAVKACIVASTRWIMLAGEKVAEHFKLMAIKVNSRVWTKQNWKNWAAKFQEIASSDSDDGPWNLKSRAAEAYARMIELYPELFEDGADVKNKAGVQEKVDIRDRAGIVVENGSETENNA